MARSKTDHGVTLEVYEQLLQINAGFEQVSRALHGIGRNRLFDRQELERYRALAAEAQALINSYLSDVIETTETDQAGRLSRRRLARERRESAS